MWGPKMASGLDKIVLILLYVGRFSLIRMQHGIFSVSFFNLGGLLPLLSTAGIENFS